MYQLKSLKIVNFISFKEQEFQFRNGKAILIVGDNQTDPSQRGNGAGKSAFIEAISVAFSGSPMRDVKTKELVSRGEDAAELTLCLYNTETTKDFVIWRKLHTGSKSAEYRAWIDGKEQNEKYADFNQFNDFVWATVGISKEDFFSFYLLSRATDYKPFLNAPDGKKKEIISRFSGADKVDVVFPEIENDSLKLGTELQAIEKELVQNTTRQEVIAEQLVKEEESVSDEKKLEKIAAKEQELETIIAQGEPILLAISETKTRLSAANKSVNDFDALTFNALEPFKEALELAELEVEAFEYTMDYETVLASYVTEKAAINVERTAKQAELPKVKDKFKAEIEAITKEEAETRESIADAQRELQENEKFESEVTKSLHDSIECPNCHHHFSLRDATFNYEEAKAKLPDIQAAITDYKALIKELNEHINVHIQQKKTDVNNKITAAGDGIRKELEAYNGQLIEIGNKETATKQKYQQEQHARQLLVNDVATANANLKNKEQQLNNELQQLKNAVRQVDLSLQAKERELQAHNQKVSALQNEIDNLINQEADRTKINELTAAIEILVAAEEKIKERLDIKRKEKETVDAWGLHFKSFKSSLANRSIKSIADYTNLFLEGMGSDISVQIDGYRVLASKKISEKITTTILRGGFEEGSYGAYSGGERGRVDTANTLSLQELINVSSPTGGLDFLLIDECLDQVDELGLELIITSLQSLGKSIMIISQLTGINSINEHVVIIQKKNKVSTIIN